MSWFSSLFVKKKPQQKQWSVRQIRIQRINCVNCNKPFKDHDMVWVSPSGHLVQHTDCAYTQHVPNDWTDEHGLLKE